MENDRLKFCIERFDHYYDSVNNKSAVFLGLSTFIVGGLVAAYPSILTLVNCGILVHLMMTATIALGLTVMIIVILASTPFLSKESDSILYFGAISRLSVTDYCDRSTSCAAEDELADLRNQAYRLSKGLEKKFKKLKMAGTLITLQFILFIPLILLIITNLK